MITHGPADNGHRFAALVVSFVAAFTPSSERRWIEGSPNFQIFRIGWFLGEKSKIPPGIVAVFSRKKTWRAAHARQVSRIASDHSTADPIRSRNAR